MFVAAGEQQSSHQRRSEIRSRLNPLRERRTGCAAGCTRSAHRRCTVPPAGRRAHDFTLWCRLRTATAPCHGPTNDHCLADTNCPRRRHAARKIRLRQRPRCWHPHTRDHRGRRTWARRSRYTAGVGPARCGSRMGCSSLVDRATSSNTQFHPVGMPRISTPPSTAAIRSYRHAGARPPTPLCVARSEVRQLAEPILVPDPERCEHVVVE